MDYQHNFKKKFGQNFLNDENILNKIIKESEIPDDTLVIEIGPGAGALTNKLKEVAKNVLAYEIDLDLQNILIDKFKDTNVTFIWEDFLNRNIKEDIKEYKYSHIFVVANIPYYITTPIVEKIINSGVDVEKVVIMVQKEVGDRFSAKPGNKDYGSISVFLNYYYNIKELFIVSKNCFTPRPNVDSVILSLEKRTDRPQVQDEKVLFKLIKDSFRFKRKNLRNNLKEYDLVKVEEILKKYNKDLTARAETLDLEIFVDIANNI
ncbi:MAG: ribosomal RNA small subunit methyltransferase A [Bacilli bacterium]|nr:ribosomal RNA small subunit methyltransferase A [Bacilli bacterium]